MCLGSGTQCWAGSGRPPLLTWVRNPGPHKEEARASVVWLGGRAPWVLSLLGGPAERRALWLFPVLLSMVLPSYKPSHTGLYWGAGFKCLTQARRPWRCSSIWGTSPPTWPCCWGGAPTTPQPGSPSIGTPQRPEFTTWAPLCPRPPLLSGAQDVAVRLFFLGRRRVRCPSPEHRRRPPCSRVLGNEHTWGIVSTTPTL